MCDSMINTVILGGTGDHGRVIARDMSSDSTNVTCI